MTMWFKRQKIGSEPRISPTHSWISSNLFQRTLSVVIDPTHYQTTRLPMFTSEGITTVRWFFISNC